MPTTLKSRDQKDYKDGVKTTNNEFQLKESRSTLIASSINDRNEIENSKKTDSQKIAEEKTKAITSINSWTTYEKHNQCPKIGENCD